jgi:hypothetical protein
MFDCRSVSTQHQKAKREYHTYFEGLFLWVLSSFKSRGEEDNQCFENVSASSLKGEEKDVGIARTRQFGRKLVI